MADINVYDSISGLSDSATVNTVDCINAYDSISLLDGIGRNRITSEAYIILNEYVGGAAYSGFGQQFPCTKSFEWRTDLVRYDSGREQRNQIYSQPIRRWKINWQVMNESARNRLIEVFGRMRGMYRTFLWWDRDDYHTTSIIITDGTENEYQLVRTYNYNEFEEWSEDKKDICPASVFSPVIYHSVDGLQSRVTSNPPGAANQYYLNNHDGLLVFDPLNPPSAGELSCSFEYYFRVRFDFDEYMDIMFTRDYWQAEGLNLIEVIT